MEKGEGHSHTAGVLSIVGVFPQEEGVSVEQWKKSISGYLSGLDRVLCWSFVVIVRAVSAVTTTL